MRFSCILSFLSFLHFILGHKHLSHADTLADVQLKLHSQHINLSMHDFFHK